MLQVLTSHSHPYDRGYHALSRVQALERLAQVFLKSIQVYTLGIPKKFN